MPKRRLLLTDDFRILCVFSERESAHTVLFCLSLDQAIIRRFFGGARVSLYSFYSLSPKNSTVLLVLLYSNFCYLFPSAVFFITLLTLFNGDEINYYSHMRNAIAYFETHLKQNKYTLVKKKGGTFNFTSINWIIPFFFASLQEKHHELETLISTPRSNSLAKIT